LRISVDFNCAFVIQLNLKLIW